MAKLRFYTCCILFVLLFAGMFLVAAVFLLFWHRSMSGAAGIDVTQPEVVSDVFQMVGFYIFITAFFLSFIGYFFLSRKLLRPIERLTGQAEHFSGATDTLLFSSDSGEGFHRLSRALNHLVGQLKHEQEQLQITVKALAKANEDLLATQHEMVRTEKLVSIGRLSAGLAHEIGNPLTILSGYLELLKNPDLDEPLAHDFLARATKEAERMDTLIQRLLEFARPSSGELRQCSLHQVISECFDDLRCQPLFKNITFQQQLLADKDTVWADPGQIRQVLLNCMVNAADAIHEKQGACEHYIKIETTIGTIGDDAEEYIVITLKDSGTGIFADQLSSVFDPFFTTKDAGKGTGLGMSVCYMIIQEMEGSIEISSQQGKGAKVTISLKLYNVAAEANALQKD